MRNTPHTLMYRLRKVSPGAVGTSFPMGKAPKSVGTNRNGSKPLAEVIISTQIR